MSAEHTPGPWKAMAAGISASMVSTTLKSGRRVPFRVAVCKDGGRNTVEANAHLIAAAPLMLAACEALILTGNLQEAIDIARRALASIGKIEAA